MKKLKKPILIALFATVFIFFSLSLSHATLVYQQFDVVIDAFEPGNQFGVTGLNTYDGYTIYDTDELTGSGSETVYLGEPYPDYELSLQVGNRTFREYEDVDYEHDPYFPSLLFSDGDLIAVSSFNVNLDSGGIFSAYYEPVLAPNFSIFLATNPTVAEIFGHLEFNYAPEAYSRGPSPAPIPEPATMLMLGSGLIGLAGVGRKVRKKQAKGGAA